MANQKIKLILTLVVFFGTNLYASSSTDNLEEKFKQIIIVNKNKISSSKNKGLQWQALEAFKNEIKKFEDDNDAKLSSQLRINMTALRLMHLAALPEPAKFIASDCPRYREKILEDTHAESPRELDIYEKTAYEIIDSICKTK